MIWSLLVIIFGGAGLVNPQSTNFKSAEDEFKIIGATIYNKSNTDYTESAHQLTDNIEADLKNEITQKLLHSGSDLEIANITDIITDRNNNSRSVIVVVVTNTLPLPNGEAKKKPNKLSVNEHQPGEIDTQPKNDLDTGTVNVTPGKNPFQKITSYLSDTFGFGNVVKTVNGSLETDNTENVDESSDRISNEQQVDNIEFSEESLEEADITPPSVPDSDQIFAEGNQQSNGILFHLNPQHETNQPTSLNIDVANLAEKATEAQIFESSFAEVSTPQVVLPNIEIAEQNQMNQQATIESLKDGKSVVHATPNGKPLQNQENDRKNSLQTDVLQSSAFSLSEAPVSEAITRLEYSDPKDVKREHAAKVFIEPIEDEERLLNVSEVQIKQNEENRTKEKLEVSRKHSLTEDEFQWHENIVAPSIHDRFSLIPKTDNFENSLTEHENGQIKIYNISSNNRRFDTRKLDGNQAQNSNDNFVILDSAQQSQINNKKINEIVSNEAVVNNIDSQSQNERRLPFATMLPPTIVQLVKPLTTVHGEDPDDPITDFLEARILKNEHPEINSIESNMNEYSVNSSTISSDSPIESQLKSSNKETASTAYDPLDDFTGISEIQPRDELIDDLVKDVGDELNDPDKVNADSKLNLIHLKDSHDNASSINLNEFLAITEETEVQLSRNSNPDDNTEFEASLLEHDPGEMGKSVDEVNANASHLEKSGRTEVLSGVDLLTADKNLEKILTNDEEALKENILLPSSHFDQQASLKAKAVNPENIPFRQIQPEEVTIREKVQENDLRSNGGDLNSQENTLKNDLVTSEKEKVAKATNDNLNEIIHEKWQSIENMSEVVETLEELYKNQDLKLSSDISEDLPTAKSNEADSKLDLEATEEKTDEAIRAELNSIDKPKGSELNEILPMNDVAGKELETYSNHKADLQAAKEAPIINLNVVENFKDLPINKHIPKVEKATNEEVTTANVNLVDHEKERNGDSHMKAKVDSNQGVAEANVILLETDKKKASNPVLSDVFPSEGFFSSVPVKDAEAALDTESNVDGPNENSVQPAQEQSPENANDIADIELNEAYPNDDLLAMESGSFLTSLQSAPDNDLSTTSSENNPSLQVSNSSDMVANIQTEIKINPVSIGADTNDEPISIKSEVTSPEVIVENAEVGFQDNDKSAVLSSESSGAALPQDFHSHPIHEEHKKNDKDSALLQQLIHSKDFTGPLTDSKSLKMKQNYNVPEIKNHIDEVAAEAKEKEVNAENLYRNNDEIRITTNDENMQMAKSIENNEESDHVAALREEIDTVSVTSGQGDMLTETKQSKKILISETTEGDSKSVVNSKSTNADTNNDNEIRGKQDGINRLVEKFTGSGAPSDSIFPDTVSVSIDEGDPVFDGRSNPLFEVQELEKKLILDNRKDNVFQNNAVQPDPTIKKDFKNTLVTDQNLSVDEVQISMKTNSPVDSLYSMPVLTDQINQIPDKSQTGQDNQGIEMKLSTKKQTKTPSDNPQIPASVKNNQQENAEDINHNAKTGEVSHPSILIDDLYAKENAVIKITKESAEPSDSIKNKTTSYAIVSKNHSEVAVLIGGEEITITVGDLKHKQTGESQIENITPAVNSFDQVSTNDDSSTLVLLGNFDSIQNLAANTKINKADTDPITASANNPVPFSFRNNSNPVNSPANPSNFVAENKQDGVKTITISEKSAQNFITSEMNDRNGNSTSDIQTIPLEKEIKGIKVLNTSTDVDIKGPGKDALTAYGEANTPEAENSSNRNQQIYADWTNTNVAQENIKKMKDVVELQHEPVKIIDKTQNSSKMESKTVEKDIREHPSIENSKSSSDCVDKESEITSIIGKTDQKNSLDTKQYLEKNKEESSNKFATEASTEEGHHPNLNKPIADRDIFPHDFKQEANMKDKNLKEFNEDTSAEVEHTEPALENLNKISPKQTNIGNTNLKEENMLASKIEADPENNEVRKVKDPEGNSDDSSEDDSCETTEQNRKDDKSQKINLVEIEKSNEGSQEAIEADDNDDSDHHKKVPSIGEKRKAKELYLPDLSEISNNEAESSEENNDDIDTNPKSTTVLQRRSMMEQLFPLSNVLQLENSTPYKENPDSLDTRFDNGDLHTVVKRPGAHTQNHDTTTILPYDLKKNIEILKPLKNQIINASKAKTDPSSNVKTIRDLIDLNLVKSNFVADSPSTSTNQESSRQHGPPNTLTGILSLSLSLSLLTILILSSFLIYYLKLRNHRGILNIEMIEQQTTPN